LTSGDVGPYAGENVIPSGIDTKRKVYIKCYPIPTDSRMYLSNSHSQIREIEIIDVEGQIVLSRLLKNSLSKIEIGMTSLSNGLYIVRARTVDGNIESQKILVQH